MSALVREFTPTFYSTPSLWQQLGIAERGPKLYQALHEGFHYAMFDKLAQISGLDKKQLASLCQLAPATLARRAKLGKFTQDESDRLHRFATVLVAANTLFNDDMNAARRWLTEPVYGLGDKAPLDILGTTAETQAILDLIGRLEHGVFA